MIKEGSEVIFDGGGGLAVVGIVKRRTHLYPGQNVWVVHSKNMRWEVLEKDLTLNRGEVT